MAALAVLLIVGGALASGWLALRTGDRADYLRVTTDVPQGEQIEASDLGVVSLPDDLSDEYVLASREEEVLGQEATTPLRPGMVLSSDLFSDDARTAPGETQQSLEIAENGIPAEATDGSSILIFLTSGESDTAQVTAVSATVVRIDLPETGEGGIGGGTSSALGAVTVSIPAPCADEVAQASISGEFTIQLSDPEDAAEAELNPCARPDSTPTKGTG